MVVDAFRANVPGLIHVGGSVAAGCAAFLIWVAWVMGKKFDRLIETGDIVGGAAKVRGIVVDSPVDSSSSGGGDFCCCVVVVVGRGGGVIVVASAAVVAVVVCLLLLLLSSPHVTPVPISELVQHMTRSISVVTAYFPKQWCGT